MQAWFQPACSLHVGLVGSIVLWVLRRSETRPASVGLLSAGGRACEGAWSASTQALVRFLSTMFMAGFLKLFKNNMSVKHNVPKAMRWRYDPGITSLHVKGVQYLTTRCSYARALLTAAHVIHAVSVRQQCASGCNAPYACTVRLPPAAQRPAKSASDGGYESARLDLALVSFTAVAPYPASQVLSQAFGASKRPV
jgi:hypothetical protein